MVEAGSIWIRLGLNTDELRFGLDKAKYGLMEWRDETNKSTGEMAKWAAAITATVAPIIAAGTAVYALQQRYGSMASQITDLSTTTGLSTDKIQQLQRAAILSNSEFSNVTMGVNTLTLAISKAGDASSDAGKAFSQLGVSPGGKSVDQVFEDTTNALIGMEDTTRRNEIAMTLYGRSWKEMLPFMEDYIKNKEKIQSSPTFSKQELQDLKDAKAAWDDLGNSVTIYSGKALSAVQKQFSSENIESVLTLDRAYRKLFSGDIGGYLKEASDYRTDQIKKEQQKIKDLLAENAASAPSLAIPGSDLDTEDAQKAAEQAEKDRVTALVDAWKEYQDQVKKVQEETKKLQDLNRDFTREMTALNPRDVSAARNLIIKHNYAVQDQQAASIAAAQGLSASATEFNAIRAGVPLDQIKGTTAYTEAQAKKSGDLIINIDGKQLAKIPGVATTTGKMNLMQRGIS